MGKDGFFLLKLRPKLSGHRWVPYTVASCSAVALYVLLTNLNEVRGFLAQIFSYLSPVIYGIIIAYLLNPIVRFFADRCFGWMRHRKLARGLGVAIATLLLLLALAFIAISIFPQLIASVEGLVANLDQYVAGIQSKLNELAARFEFLHLNLSETIQWTQLLKKAVEWLPQNLPAILNTSVRIGSGVFNACITFIIAIYILMDQERLVHGIKSLCVLVFSPTTCLRLRRFCAHCNHIILRYVGSDLLDSLIIGVANFLFMLIFNMPYPLLISVIVGITNLIPTFGPIIGAVPSALIILLVNPWKAFWFIIWTMILQTLDGYVIKPLLYGDTLGLPAVWVLISIIVGGRIFGILGVLLAIPFAAICSYLIDKIIQKKQLARAAADGASSAASDAPPPVDRKEQSDHE